MINEEERKNAIDALFSLPDNAMLEAREVALIFGVTKSTIYRWILKSKFPEPLQTASFKKQGKQPFWLDSGKSRTRWLVLDIKKQLNNMQENKQCQD